MAARDSPRARHAARSLGTVPARQATPDENTFLICWEDRTGETSDYDHNDLILEMTFVPLPQN